MNRLIRFGTIPVRPDQPAGVVGQQRQAAAVLLGPAAEGVARLEMQSGGAPRGQGQPVPLVTGDVTHVFAHKVGALQIMMLDEEFIELSPFGRRERAHREVDQHVLFIGSEWARAARCVFHAGSVGKGNRFVPPNRSTFFLAKRCRSAKTRPTTLHRSRSDGVKSFQRVRATAGRRA